MKYFHISKTAKKDITKIKLLYELLLIEFYILIGKTKDLPKPTSYVDGRFISQIEKITIE